MTRCVVVGAPRSGTTLLQARLAVHPALITFPETHFFEVATRDRSRFQRRFDLPSTACRGYMEDFINEACRRRGCDPGPILSGLYGFRLRSYAHQFFACLDQIARRQANVHGWIEKTPGHVRHITRLEHVADAMRFVHIIRSGIAVVGSLYDVTRRYPESWGGAWSIDRCIRTWNDDVSHSLEHYRRPHHFLIRYEDFVCDPERYVNSIWRFLSLPQYACDPQAPVSDESRFIESFERWKSDATGPVMKTRHRRVDDLLGTETVASVRKDLTFGGEVPPEYFSKID